MKGEKFLKESQKFIQESLSFLDITWVRILLIVLLVLYIAAGIPLLTSEVAEIFQNPLVKILFVLFILYVGLKDIPLALLLALAFVLSLQMGYRFKLGGQLTAGPLEAGAQVDATESGIGVAGSAGLGPAQLEGSATLGESNVEAMTGQNNDEPDGGNYNQYFDCVKNCADNDLGQGSLDTPCKGVGVWKNELNAQGLNCPLGYSGKKEGAPF
jgi:hypothetical protein